MGKTEVRRDFERGVVVGARPASDDLRLYITVNVSRVTVELRKIPC